MNSNPLCFTCDTPIGPAVREMAETQRSCIVIIEKGKPVGIVTERDIAKAFALAFDDCAGMAETMSEIMTPQPVCIDGTMAYQDALTLSRSRGLRHLPVVDNEDNLIGVVTQTSLLDAFSSLLNEQERLENSIEELKALSLEDPLMQIGNRRAMEVDLNYTAAEAERHDKCFAVALFDIDFFKRYNDRYGHQAGDEALQSVAAAIQKTIRDSDRTYRYGGEEILVLMPETNDEQAAICAERIRSAVEHLEIPHEDSELGKLTISGGYISQRHGHWENMIEKADQALYQAKSSGRNRVASA